MERIYELIKNLIDTTKSKKELYGRYMEITKNQSTTIGSEDYNKLDAYISEKQSIINQVDKLDNDFNDTFIEVKNILAVDDLSKIDTTRYPGFKELKQLIIEITAIGKEIQELDIINQQKVSKEMESVRSELIKINDSKKVTSAYHKVYSQTPDAYYFDKKK